MIGVSLADAIRCIEAANLLDGVASAVDAGAVLDKPRVGVRETRALAMRSSDAFVFCVWSEKVCCGGADCVADEDIGRDRPLLPDSRAPAIRLSDDACFCDHVGAGINFV